MIGKEIKEMRRSRKEELSKVEYIKERGKNRSVCYQRKRSEDKV